MKRGQHLGFTLVEMLVTITIFLLIVFPFVTTYVVTGKVNQDSLYMRKSTDILKVAGEDVRTWNSDILEVLSDRVEGGKLREWKYQKDWMIKHNVNNELREDKTSMYEIFRKALDGEEDWEDGELELRGTDWQKGMDIYFTVERVESGGDTTNVGEDIRGGYDLNIRVGNDIQISRRGRGIVTEGNNNGGRGYYLKVTLKDNKSEYILKRVPEDYIPLEKYDGNDGSRILFGGKKWLKLFEASPGDVALIYAPESDLFDIEKPFEVTSTSEGNLRFNRNRGWSNLASYLNDQFYNSLSYSTVSLNYTNRSWIKKHTWLIGPEGDEESEIISENVGLLRYNEKDLIKKNVADYLEDTYTLTPAIGDNKIRLLSGIPVNPEGIYKIYPVIYLDSDLYMRKEQYGSNASLYKLYESTDEVLKKGEVVKVEGEVYNDAVECAGADVNVLVYFDNRLAENNLEGKYFEKLRLLVDVEDMRTNKKDDGLKIYTVNNKKRENYSWLELRNATRVMMEGDDAKSVRFKVIDSIKVDEDVNTDDTKWSGSTKDMRVKKAYVMKEYEVRVWAEYMATDEYSRVNPDDYPDKSKLPKKRHEELVLRVTKKKDQPTFMYGNVDNMYEVDNILDINELGLLNKMKDYFRISK